MTDEVPRTIEELNRELQTKVEKISEQQRRILALQQQLTSQTKFATKEVADALTIPAPPTIKETSVWALM